MRQLKLELRGDRDVPIDGKADLFGSRSMGTPCAQTRVSEWATHDGEGEQGAMPRAYLLLCGQEPTVTRSRAPSTSALQPMTSPPYLCGCYHDSRPTSSPELLEYQRLVPSHGAYSARVIVDREVA